MSQSFVDFLNENKVDSGTLEQALLMYLNKLTNNSTLEDLFNKIVEATNNPDQVEWLINQLQTDSQAVEETAIALFLAVWSSSPEGQEDVRKIIEYAQETAPIQNAGAVGIGVAAVLAILCGTGTYFEYLKTTGGIHTTEHTISKGPNGTYTETKRTTYSPYQIPFPTFSETLQEGLKVFGDDSSHETQNSLPESNPK